MKPCQMVESGAFDPDVPSPGEGGDADEVGIEVNLDDLDDAETGLGGVGEEKKEEVSGNYVAKNEPRIAISHLLRARV